MEIPVSPMKVAVHCRSLRLPYSLRAKGVWSGQTPKATLRESPSLRNTLKLTTQKSPGPTGTLMALLRMQFGMEGQEST